MEDKLRSVMARILGVKEQDLSDESSHKNVKTWDSLRHIRLVLAIEEEFRIDPLDMDQIVEMTSFSGIKRILRKKGVAV